MSILSLIINALLLCQAAISFKQVIDTEIGRTIVLDCPIDRNKWSLPLIIQWYRAVNNYSRPVASQFDAYPVHVDDLYLNKYSLLANGSLQIDHIQLSDNDTFECRVILIDRGLLDTKEKQLLTVRINEPPRFIERSNAVQVVLPYSTVKLICRTYGVPHPTVSWYKILEGERTRNKEDLQLLLANRQHFTLENVDDRAAGKYRCVGANQLGSIEHEFQLFIRGSIYWRQFPRNQTVQINGSVIFKCEGESSEPLQYQWWKDDVPITDTISSPSRIRTFSDGVLMVDHIEPSDHGSYVCVISVLNSTTIRSKPAVLTVKYPPIPSRRRLTSNLTLIQGALGVCPCLLVAYPPIQSVSWYRNGRSIHIQPKGGAYTVNSEYALVIRSVDSDDEGKYFCRAQNSEGFGHDSVPFYIEVKEPIKFISKPKSMYHVRENDRLVLPCVAFGDPRPAIKWFKNSVALHKINENLTLDSIEKTDHGLYICQASNEHTTTNVSTLIIVENTTPQAPLNVQYQQIFSNLLLSWEAGYDGGRPQHFIIWYRLIQNKKQNWHQIRVLPRNATEFMLFDLQLQQTYELTIVAENDNGLGTFSPIISVYLNNQQDLPIGHLHHSNDTNLLRPLPPVDLHLFRSGSNLHITWNQADVLDSPVNIVYYVIQWRSTIVFNNQQSQQSIVVPYPSRSHILKGIRESKYIVQVMSYSDQGMYSTPIESQIDIEFNSILAYYGSSRLLISILCFLTVLTVATLCICIFCILKHHYQRQSYCTDGKSDDKLFCCCLPSIQYRLDSCSPSEKDRYSASLLKTTDLPPSPMYSTRHRVMSQTVANSRRPLSSPDSSTTSSVSLAKVTTIPSCRNSIVSNSNEPLPLTYATIPTDTPHVIPSSALTLILVPNTNDESKMTSFFQPITIGSASYSDYDSRKNTSRLPLEAVPELSELSVDHSRHSYAPSVSSTVHSAQHPQSVPPSPILVTFDSNSLKRRT